MKGNVQSIIFGEDVRMTYDFMEEAHVAAFHLFILVDKIARLRSIFQERCRL